MAKKRIGATPGPFIDKVWLDRTRISDPKHYAYNLPAIKWFREMNLHPNVTLFVGENGSGKSTMLEALAVANGLNAEGGSRNIQFSTRKSHSELYKSLRLEKFHALIPDAWFLRAESLFNVATQIEKLDEEPSNSRKIIESYGGGSLHEQSHGESFMALIENRFKQGLYFLDEPEAALSPQRQLQFLILLHRLVENKSQLVIATHSPIIMAYPQAKIMMFTQDGIKETALEDTEHFRITKMFLNGPERMLKHLLGPDELS